MSYTPPRIILSLFRWFCDPALTKYIEGDLIELYSERRNAGSKFRADLLFVRDVILLFRPGVIKSFNRSSSINRTAMYKSYFKTGWRNLLKQRTYSVIKIGGFSLSVAVCFLIAMWIRDEVSYDSFYPNASRVFRLVGVVNKEEGTTEKGVHFQPPMAQALVDDLPEIEKAGRYNNVELFGAANAAIRRSDRVENNYEESLAYFDQSLLEILQLPLLQGNPTKALATPYSIVISRKKAAQYFPDEDPIGKSLIINDDVKHPYTIGGVLDDVSEKSHLNFDFLLTLTAKEFWPGEQTDWCCSNYPTYVLLKEGVNAEAFAGKMTGVVIEKYVRPRLVEQGRTNIEEYLKTIYLELQPVSKVHLYSAGIQDDLSHGDIRFVWMFAAVAVFVLMIACINFINLSTAKSANRAKEVGLRKVVGSFRSDLVNQFMIESLLYSFLSFIIGMALASLILPFFNEIAGKNLEFPWKEWWLMPIVVGASLVVGVTAGAYPSFYLSSFRPIQVLKGRISRGSSTSSMRATLVVFQFTISIVLIVATFVIYRQMQFILNTKIGFNKDNVLVIQGTHMLGEKVDLLKERLLENPNIEFVSIGDYLPVRGTKRNGNQFAKEGRAKIDGTVSGQFWQADEDYINVMGMNVIQGRNFNPELESDKGAVIINQRMAKELNLDNPIGERISNGNTFNVVGVVEDFHFDSFKQGIEPLAISFNKSPTIVSARVKAGSDPSDIIKSVTALWKEMAPNQPIRYTFLDQSYARMYDDVRRMSVVFTSCAVFAIMVACLGLFGLSAFMAEQRSKEISIRLVLGASLKSILVLIMQNFFWLIIISFVFSAPLAWYVTNQWLQDYVYRIDLTWDVFIIAGCIALGIALLTISYQSIRAALINPVDNLRAD